MVKIKADVHGDKVSVEVSAHGYELDDAISALLRLVRDLRETD